MKISVITITFNNYSGLKTTLQSIAQNKDLAAFEYIIVNGGNDRSTFEVIKSYSSLIDILIQEPDDGIYDAMNKGIAASTGDFCIFMNAGDLLCSANVIKTISFLDLNKNCFYCCNAFVNHDGHMKTFPRLDVDSLYKGIICSHQALIHPLSWLKKNMFNIQYKIGADYDLLCRAFKSDIPIKSIDIDIAIVEPGGLSDKKRFKSINERRKIATQYFSKLKVSLYYTYLIAKQLFTSMVKAIFPKKLHNLFRRR